LRASNAGDLMSASIRTTNSRIAELYDALPYDPQPNALLAPERLMGLGALYGCRGEIGDVLDIGCGTGVELARLGQVSSGRLVGIDLSAAAVAMAQQRSAAFGPRAEVSRADVMDLSPSVLGQFDLILHFGVIFVVPAEVRAQILRLIAGCLKPGGVAVISYYAGTLPSLRANLHRSLRAAHDPAGAPGEEIAKARAALQALAASVPQAQPGRDLLLSAITLTAKQGDVVFFHEVLNHVFEALQTSELEAAMAGEGVRFLSYLGENAPGTGPSSKLRAAGADALDFMHGGYRHAVFGKPPTDAAPAPRDERVRWRTALQRKGPVDYGAAGQFANPETGAAITAGNDYAQALIDTLIEQPMPWAAATRAAHARLGRAASPIPEEALASLERDLVALFRLNAVQPVMAVAAG
jgi:SAM-dependent methyltransferase